MNDMLFAKITKEELRELAFAIRPSNSPEPPDGIMSSSSNNVENWLEIKLQRKCSDSWTLALCWRNGTLPCMHVTNNP